MAVLIPAYYYAQQGADIALPYPGESFGGWKRTQVPVDLDHTAVIVMHAWELPGPQEDPGLYQHVEYIQRADRIMKEKLLPMLEHFRRSSLRVIHVAAGFETALQSLPGYQRVCGKVMPEQYETISVTPEHEALRQKHWRLTGAESEEHNRQLEEGYSRYDFAAKPLDEEDVVCAANQLFALCREHRIEHLIYMGFAVNACLSFSPCGMLDMSRRGLMCSIVGDVTTAVENKESCREQSNLRYGLWQFAVQSGFVFLSEELKACIGT